MISKTFILSCILGVLALIVVLYLIYQMSKKKVWITALVKNKTTNSYLMEDIGYLDYGTDGEVSCVYLSGIKGNPVGRLQLDDNGEKCNVSVLKTPIDESGDDAQYRTCGFITPDGFIYRRLAFKDKPVKIGYTARPSDPNTPTIKGERSWKTLWLRKRLDAYLGMPDGNVENKEELSPVNAYKTLIINAEAKKEETTEENDSVSFHTNSQDVINNPQEEIPNDFVSEETNDSSSSTNLKDTSTDIEGSDIQSTEDENLKTAEDNLKTGEITTDDTAKDSEQESPSEENAAENAETSITDDFSLPEEERKRLDRIKANNLTSLQHLANNMVSVNGGTFLMGRKPQDNTTFEDSIERGKVEENESPVHRVTLSNYFIGKFPVCQDEWQLIMGYNNSECRENTKYPVAPVTWNECQEFLKRLSYVMGVKFYLPTEAQWEYAARGGEKSHNYTFSGSDKFLEVGQNDFKNPVGTKRPNELGIFDMSGLVREWCQDNYGKYTEEDQVNPMGPDDNSDLLFKNENDEITKVVRSPRNNETVTNRKGEDVNLSKGHKSYGFRIVCYNLPSFKESMKEDTLNFVTDDGRFAKPLEHQKKLVAKCHSNGFHFGRRDTLTAESRACAFGVFFNEYNKQDYGEYYKNNPYGWRDTAFISATIYSVAYVLFFLIYREVLGFHFIGFKLYSAYTVIGYYFCLWALIRMIKIDYAENGQSFQPQIDLFNKVVGQKRFDSIILTCCSIALPLIFSWYHKFDFLPLVVVIMIGTSINLSMRINRMPWIVKKKFDNIHEEDDGLIKEVKNPDGDIAKTYDWDLDSIENRNHILHGNLTLYFYAKDIYDLRLCNPFYQQLSLKTPSEYVNDMFKYLVEHPDLEKRVKYIADIIKKKAVNLNELDKVQFVLDFVQEPNIQFVRNEDSKSIDMFKDYIRFPDETLYDKEADAASKAFLAAMIFHEMKYNVLYMTSRKYQHAAIGVEILKDYEQLLSGHRLEEVSFVEGEKRYFFCETTGDKFKIGNTIKSMNVEDDFDINVPLMIENDDVDDSASQSNTVSKIYNWKLDPTRGNVIGNCTLNFNREEITDLRLANPFRQYPQNGISYEQNVSFIFKFITQQPERMSKIREIVEHIKTIANESNLSSFDTLQFTLDFAQAPNIIYCVDEKSPGINFAKEYMRFPDEVLFDKEGDCDCKSSLTAALFHELGYNVIFLISEKLNHAAIGVEYKDEWLNEIDTNIIDRVTREHNGKKYIYCETTSEGFKIGFINEGESMMDFDSIVEFPA